MELMPEIHYKRFRRLEESVAFVSTYSGTAHPLIGLCCSGMRFQQGIRNKLN